jgi:alpha-galactosidase
MDWKEWRIANGAVVEERPKSEATLRRLLHDLRAVPRDIVLSLSPLSESGNAANLAKHSNLWRITGDIHDEWAAIRRCFELTDWYRWTRPGAYCDPDMLQVGLFGTPNRQNRVLRPTRLTENEQITQMSLWALVSAPLLLSCDIESLDAFTMALITNDEVIDIDQDALCRAAVRVRGGDDAQVWRKELENGDLAVGIFNLSERPEQIHVAWAELDIQGTWYARDLWNPGEVARSAEGCIRTVASHGCALLRLRRDDAGDDA